MATISELTSALAGLGTKSGLRRTAKLILDAIASAGAVSSVFGRTGVVTAQAGDYTATLIGLGNVTNDAQTKAAIVPNTAPPSAAILIGSGGGSYGVQIISGSGASFSLSPSGVLTVSNIANASLLNDSITISGTNISLGGTVTLDTLFGFTGLQVGLLKKTGSDLYATVTAPSGAIVGTTDTQTLSNKTLSGCSGPGLWDEVLRVTGSDFSTTSTTLVTVTGLTSSSLPVTGWYEFEAVLRVNSSTTAGMTMAIDDSSTVNLAQFNGTATANSATAVSAIGQNTGNAATAAFCTQIGDGSVYVRGFVKANAGTAISIKVAKVTSGTAKVYIGSTFRWRTADTGGSSS